MHPGATRVFRFCHVPWYRVETTAASNECEPSASFFPAQVFGMSASVCHHSSMQPKEESVSKSYHARAVGESGQCRSTASFLSAAKSNENRCRVLPFATRHGLGRERLLGERNGCIHRYQRLNRQRSEWMASSSRRCHTARRAGSPMGSSGRAGREMGSLQGSCISVPSPHCQAAPKYPGPI